MPIYDSFPTVISPDISEEPITPDWKQPRVQGFLPTPLDYDVNGTKTQDSSLEAYIGNKKSNYLGGVTYGEGIRYNDKDLGYNKLLNNEDIYSSKGNWYYAFRGAGSSMVDWMKEGMQSIGDVFNAVTSLDASKLYDSSHTKELLAKQDAMPYDNPVYRSEYSQNHLADPFSTGNAALNGQNMGMMAGMVVSTLAVDAAIAGGTALLSVPTLGADIPEGGAAIVGVTATMASKAWSTFKNINTISNIASVPSLFSEFKLGLAAGKTVGESLKNKALWKSAISMAGFKAKTALVSSAEAASEAQSTMQSLREKLNDSNATPDEIDKTVQAAGKSSYFLNQALLNVTMPIEFKNLFGATLTNKIISGIPVAIRADLGEKAIQAVTGLVENNGQSLFKKAIGFFTEPKTYARYVAHGLLENVLVEGGQESAQFLIQNTVDNYYRDKFDNNKRDNFLNFLGSTYKSLPSLVSEEGLANFTGGAFMGGMSIVGGGIGAQLNHRVLGGKIPFLDSKYAPAVYNKEVLRNDTMNRTENLLRYSETLWNNNQESIANADDKTKAWENSIIGVKDNNDKNAFISGMHGIIQGNIDSKIEGFKDLTTNNQFNNSKESLDLFEQMYGTNLVDPTKVNDEDYDTRRVIARDEVLNGIAKKLESVKDAYNTINNAYSVNPYDTDRGFKKIINNFKSSDVKQQAEKVWQIAKQQATELLYLQNTKSNRLENVINGITQNELFRADREDILHEFLNSPISTLKYSNTKEDVFVHLLDHIKEKTNPASILGTEYDDFLIKNDTELQDLDKLHKSLSKSLADKDLNSFYKSLYDHLHEDDSTNEANYHKFVTDATDALKLNLGYNFLVDQNKKLQSVKGQRDLIKRNLNSLQFYDFANSLKNGKAKGTVSNVSSTTPRGADILSQVGVEESEPIKEPEFASNKIQDEINAVRSELNKSVDLEADVLPQNLENTVKQSVENILKIAKDLENDTNKDLVKEIVDLAKDLVYVDPNAPRDALRDAPRDVIKRNIDEIAKIADKLKDLEKDTPEYKLYQLRNFTLNSIKPEGKEKFYFVPQEVAGVQKLVNKVRLSELVYPSKEVLEDDKRAQGLIRGNFINTLTDALIHGIYDASIIDRLDEKHKETVDGIEPKAYNSLKQELDKTLKQALKKIDPDFKGEVKDYVKNNNVQILNEQIVSYADVAGETPILIVKDGKAHLVAIKSSNITNTKEIGRIKYYAKIDEQGKKSYFQQDIQQYHGYAYMLEKKFGIKVDSAHIITIGVAEKTNLFTENFEAVTNIIDSNVSDNIFETKGTEELKNDIEELINTYTISDSEQAQKDFEPKKKDIIETEHVQFVNNGEESLPNQQDSDKIVLQNKIDELNLQAENKNFKYVLC